MLTGTPSSAAGEPAASSDAPGPAAPDGPTWVDVTEGSLDAVDLATWAAQPDCGAVVTFHGTVRDHAAGRTGVTGLTYEAYTEAAVARLEAVVEDVRSRWPDVRRIAAIHRVGSLEVGDTAVVVAVSSPHRAAAFAAAAHCIDTLKATVPLWKKETWTGGEEWGTDAVLIDDVGAGPPAAGSAGGAVR